ncbi:PAS domain S-box protein [Geitlerinema sp. PCC 9228]|uniref:PAS domain S-box protein n=1 Tax=Geitlerinema sp. PCC 9228 TaxID=111611 RepID=UPI00147CBB66|nr:PAS domain S-box protein [Geitlerinema sp. PCC 9228]
MSFTESPLETSSAKLICRFAPNGTITFVNETFSRHLGQPAAQTIGSNIFHWLSNTEWDTFQAYLRSFCPENPIGVHQQKILTADGRLCIQHWQTCAFFDVQGQVLEFQAVGVDLNNTEHLAAQLRQSQEQIASIAANIPGCVYRIHCLEERPTRQPHLYVSFISAGVQDLLGVEPSQVLADPRYLLQHIHPEDQPQLVQVMEKARSQQISTYLEYRIFPSGGELKWVRDSIHSSRTDSGQMVIDGVLLDITDRKQAEQEVRDREEQFRLLASQSPMGIFQTNDRKEVIFVSQRWCELTGLTPEQAYRQEWPCALHPEDKDTFLAAWATAETQPLSKMEFRFQRPDGSIAWVLGKARPWYSEKGEFRGLIGTLLDITERKQAEASLRKSQQFLQLVLENIPDFVFWKDFHSVYLGCNRNFARLVGVETPEAIVGKTDLELSWNREEAETFRSWDRYVMDNNCPQYHIEEQGRRSDNTQGWFDTSKIPLHDEAGNVIGILGTFADITERKHTEATLRQSEHKYRSLAKMFPNGVVSVLDSQMCYTLNEGQAAEELGFAGDVIVGKRPEEFLPPQTCQVLLPAFQQALAGGSQTIELEYEGRYFLIHISPFVQNDNQTHEIIAVAQDICDRVRAEQALRESQQKYQTLFEILPVGVSILDNTGKLIEANTASEKIFGVSRSEHNDSNYQETTWKAMYVDGTPLDKNSSPWAIALRENRTVSQSCLGLRHANGETRWLQVKAAPLPLPGYGVAVAYMDISQQRQVEKRLRQINHCFLEFDSNHLDNINTLVRVVGELLQAHLVLYNHLENDRIINFGQWTSDGSEPVFPCSDCPIGRQLLEQNQSQQTFIGHGEDLNAMECQSQLSQRFQTYMGCAVRYQGKNVGCLCLFYQNHRDFSNEDLDLLSIVASALGVEEDRYQVHQTLQLQAERERLSKAIAQKIYRSLYLEDILDTTVTDVRSILQSDRVLVYCLHENRSGTIVAEATHPEIASLLHRSFSPACFPESCYQKYQRGEIGTIDDITQGPFSPCFVEFMESIGAQSALVIPIQRWQPHVTTNATDPQETTLWGLLIVHQCRFVRHWQAWEKEWLRQIATQAGIAIQQSQLYQQLQATNTELQHLAAIDSLTKIANRRRFDEYLHHECWRCQQQELPLSLILCDIDFFKSYNDTYGHPQGDSCLQEVAAIIQKVLKRSTDIVARYGGEEFAIILPETDNQGAVRVAETIRQQIYQRHIEHRSSAIAAHITLSFGIATTGPLVYVDGTELVNRSDRALYEAKNLGRDRICIYKYKQVRHGI